MLTDHTIIIDGAQIRYTMSGDRTKQLLVFLHGWPGLSFLKSTVLHELEKDFRVVAPELPGFLWSEPLRSYHNIFEQYADVIWKIVQKENGEHKKIIIMGQSFGAPIASTFAEKYGEHVKALIITDGLMAGNHQDFLRLVLWKHGKKISRMFLRMPNRVKRAGLKAFYGVSSSSKSRKHNNALIRARVPMISNRLPLFMHSVRNGGNLLHKTYGDFPIIMLRWDKDGKEFNVEGHCPIDHAQELAEKLKNEGKNVHFITLSWGHTIFYQQPTYVIEQMKNILHEIGA